MNEIVERRLTDLLTHIVDNRGRSCPTADSGFPLIATNCVKDSELYPTFENIRFVNEETYATWFRSHPLPGDIVFVCKGSPGRTALVPDPVPFCIAQDMVALRANPTVVNNRYLYYVLQCADTRRKIENMHVGTMIPHFKKGDFNKLLLPIHSNLGNQEAIAEVLGALDNKIVANAELAKLLSDSLLAAYEYIVDTPETFVPLQELVSVTKGVSYRSADLQGSTTALVTLKSFDRNGGYAQRGLKDYVGPFKSAQKILPGELVVAQTDLTQGADVVGRVVRVPSSSNHEALIASLDLAIVRPLGETPIEYLYGALLQRRFREHCKAHTSGTTVLHLAKDAIATYPAPVVPVSDQRRFANAARPMFTLLDNTALESQTLSVMRNALLPQLMSGRMQVKDAEKLVEAAV